MAFTGPWQDRLAIRELIDAYSTAVMNGDAEAWGATWAEDSYWSLPEYPGHEEFVGRDAIVKGWSWSMNLYGKPAADGGPPKMIYVSTPGMIEVTGDEARARVYTSEIFGLIGQDHDSRTRGFYEDEMVRIDGRWLFRKRIYKVMHVA